MKAQRTIWAAWPRRAWHQVDYPSYRLMGFDSKYAGVLAIGLGVYAIAKRNIGLGPSTLIRPRFLVTGLPAVLLGIALLGLGIVMLLIRD